VTPTPFVGLFGTIITGQIERGFNDRDEFGVNAFRDANAATSQKGIWGNQRAGRHSGGTGNEGVGEHVRTRFHLGRKIAGEIAELRDPHRTKKTDFFCRTGFRALRKADPAV
jgi:hypothetical protein